MLGPVVDGDDEVTSGLMSLVTGGLVLVIVPVVVEADVPDLVAVADDDGGT